MQAARLPIAGALSRMEFKQSVAKKNYVAGPDLCLASQLKEACLLVAQILEIPYSVTVGQFGLSLRGYGTVFRVGVVAVQHYLFAFILVGGQLLTLVDFLDGFQAAHRGGVHIHQIGVDGGPTMRGGMVVDVDIFWCWHGFVQHSGGKNRSVAVRALDRVGSEWVPAF